MLGLTVKDSKEKIVFTIDKNYLNGDTWVKIMQMIRTECPIKEAAFDKSIITVGAELKKTWWQENKQQLLKDLKL